MGRTEMTGYMPPSQTDNWATPKDLWNQLNEVHRFDVDAAASQSNHLCAKWYGLDHEDESRRDGLAVQWDGDSVWINPPYGRVIKDWTQAALDHYRQGANVVMLLPARTDTRWFHDHCKQGNIEFIKGRLKFGGSTTPAPFPSMLVRFVR
jgi:phage N-6-adenine-methyltransferase